MPVAQPVYNDLIKVMNSLPEDYTSQVIDFARYLKAKADRQADIMSEGCPMCTKLRDPITGEEQFNAETIAAFKEGDAILCGEIPAKRYNSLEEMLVDLDSDD
ncbi:MAG: hypothetical protein FWD36_09040 [Treponema sp.]|nr:hypothetical protein [Treponema sp.]